MTGFATVDAIETAMRTCASQFVAYSKQHSSGVSLGIPLGFWQGTIGSPTTGTNGTLGKANGRVTTSANVGAMRFNDAPSGQTTHLVGMTGRGNLVSGTLILVDRISDVQLAHAEATGAITGVDATSRLATGEGAQLWIDVSSALSAASNTLTFDYTDQDGNAGSTAVVTTASAVVGRSVNSRLWQPLAAGDAGVRTVTNVTLTAGTATGSINLCLVRPLAYAPVSVSSATATVTSERAFVGETAILPRIYDSACLMMIFVPASTNAGQPTVHSMLRLAQG